jgi:hypothetical protein
VCGLLNRLNFNLLQPGTPYSRLMSPPGTVALLAEQKSKSTFTLMFQSVSYATQLKTAAG